MKSSAEIKIAILGLSSDPHRFAYQAAERLLAHGFCQLWGVHPKAVSVLGIPVVARLADLPLGLDTLTVYVGPELLEAMREEIFALRPVRVILNPGTESPGFASQARERGIELVQDCTLLMLNHRRF